jgi:hypothetical protein
MKCKRRKISNEFIDNYLKENNIKIKRCSEFTVSNNIMDWECLVDGYKWKTIAHSIIKNKDPTRCPKCKGGIVYTIEKIRNILNSLNIELLNTEYKNYTGKLNCKCKKCSLIFTRTYKDMQRSKRNTKYKNLCPNCNNRILYSNDNVDTLLIEHKRNIVRLSDISKAKNNVEWKCTICNTIWFTTPQSILTKIRHTGCPTCKNKKENELKRFIVDNIVSDYFKHQYKIYIDNKKRFVDFCIIKNDNVYFIERNGEQHYMPICFNGLSRTIANRNYEKQVIKDKQLKEFCEEYNIKLIVIKYDMKQEEIENIFINL